MNIGDLKSAIANAERKGCNDQTVVMLKICTCTGATHIGQATDVCISISELTGNGSQHTLWIDSERK